MASKQERDARLDELATATTEWANSERTRLKKQVTLSKRMLKGRTGAERLNNTSVTTANVLLVDEIQQYLAGA